MKIGKLGDIEEKLIFKFIVTLIVILFSVLLMLLIIKNNTSVNTNVGKHEQSYYSDYYDCDHPSEHMGAVLYTSDGESGHHSYRICGICNEVAETGPTVPHNTNSVVTNPTCTEEGYTTHTCTVTGCEYSYTDSETAAVGHSWTKTSSTSSTCTSRGYTKYKCDNCDATDTEYKPLASHEKEQHEAKAATCTAIGWEAYETCKNCSYTTYKEIAKIGHDITKVEAKAAECTEAGNKLYYECGVCEKYFEDEAGNKEITDKTSVIIPKLGHTIVTCPAKDATCVHGGNVEFYSCSTCNKIFKDAEAKIEVENKGVFETPALGHTMKKVEAKEAECTEAGNKLYYECEVCEKYFEDEAGNKEITDKTSVIIPKLGHTMKKVEAKEAECTEAGNKLYYECTVCKKYFEDEAGNKEITDKESVKIPATGHDFAGDGTPCKNCEKEHDCDSAGTYTSVETKPTCTERGYITDTCSECGDIYKHDYTEALGHTFGEWIIEKEATYEQDGYKYRICTRCNTEKDDEVIPKKEINIETTYTVEEEDNIKYIYIDKAFKVEDFLKNITSNSELTMKDKDGKVLNSDDKVPTGAKVITKEDAKEKYIVVLLGDVNCDGEVTFRDIISTNSIRINGEKDTLKVQLFAADLNNSNKIEFRDIILINSIRINAGK